MKILYHRINQLRGINNKIIVEKLNLYRQICCHSINSINHTPLNYFWRKGTNECSVVESDRGRLKISPNDWEFAITKKHWQESNSLPQYFLLCKVTIWCITHSIFLNCYWHSANIYVPDSIFNQILLSHNINDERFPTTSYSWLLRQSLLFQNSCSNILTWLILANSADFL
jgi:hypothetical protein